MARMKLTKAVVENPDVPARGRKVIWDTSPGMGGFGIRVNPSGRVSFVVRYWTGSRERWKTLGAHPRMTLSTARAKAREYLREAGDGRDLVEEQRRAAAEREAAQAQSLAILAAEWLKWLPSKVTRRGRRISPRTVDLYSMCMKVHILPALGARSITEVTRRDVLSLHRKVTRDGGPYAANRVADVLGIFYNWLRDTEALPETCPNPARRPPRNPEQRRGEHASVRLSREQEERLVRSIQRLIDGTLMRTDKRGRQYKHHDPIGGVALLTLLDSGRRKTEVLRMEWRRINLDAGTADLGSTKGKAAGDVCYLTARVREAIRRLPRIVGNPFVFHGQAKGGRRGGLQSAWELVKQEAGLEEISPDLTGFHLHDLRHHRISELLAAGVAPQLVAQQVGHTSLEQLRTYAHLQVADVAAVLSRLQPVEPPPESHLVPIATAR